MSPSTSTSSTFRFARYQIQRVYRGERAQKGRFREFYQCDIDVIGKDTLSIGYDSEIPAVIYGVFSELAFGAFTIFVNNRKLLRGLLETLQVEQQVDVLHEVDRLRKAGREKVEALLVPVIGEARAKRLLDVLTMEWTAACAELETMDNPTLKEGIDELRRVYASTLALGVPAAAIKVDLSIVRGLDYYTGTVYETFLDDHPEYGSICSGRPLRQPRRAVHEVQAAGRRHLDRRDAVVLAVARGRQTSERRQAHRSQARDRARDRDERRRSART